MSVYQKVYVSTSVKQMSANEIDILVSNATKNNIQNGITGMLLFTGTSYLQLLEGDASKVRHTYKKIQEDPRHTSFLTICERKIKKRSYPQSFSFRTTDEATLQAVYTLFLEDPDLAIKKMNLMTEVKLSKFVGFDPERLLFYSNAEPYSTTTSESFYKFSTQVAADEVFLMRDTSEIVYVNYSACKKLEYSASELIGKKVWEWDPLFPKEVWPGFWSDFINKKHLHFQTQHKKKSGEVFPVEIHAHLYEENDKQYLLAFVNDISQKMQAQKELTEHKKNLENIIHLRTEKLTQIYEELMLHKQMLDKYISVLILDDELNVKYENEYFLNIVSKLQVDLEDIHKSIQEQIKKKVQIQDKFSNACLWKGEITLSNKSDIKILFEVSLYLFEKEGKEGFYLVAYDITEKIEYQEVLRYYANHDPLSGLKNFNEFSNVFGKLQRLCMRQGDGSKFALMLIDIDDFKDINDTKGHPTGDKVIRYIADLLTTNSRNKDEVFRIGGDEFAILTYLFKDNRVAHNLAKRILSCFNKDANINGEALSISCSIGVAVYPDNATILDDLLVSSDYALYQAKCHGKGRFNAFNKEISKQLQRYIFIKNNIQDGINNDEFYLAYQPIVDTNSDTVIAYEALARWKSKLGDIPPDEFIDVAERANEMHLLSNYLLKKVIADYDKYFTGLKVAINCTSKQLTYRDSFSEYLLNLVAEYNLTCDKFILEIPETAFIKDLEHTSKILKKLIDKGFAIAIDNFGTGYSSLSLLANLPYNYIKIDKSFAKESLRNSEKKVLEIIIHACQSLGKELIIEGIESNQQIKILKSMGVTFMQGYYFAKPEKPN